MPRSTFTDQIYIAFGLFLFFLSLSACSTTTLLPINVHLSSAALLNPDPQQRALPVVMRVYQLAEDEAFLEANFQQLWKHDRTVLTEALLSRKEITVLPNQQRQFSLKRHPDAHYLAVVALFRHPQQQHWRAIIKMPAQMQTFWQALSIRLAANRVEVGR